MLGLWSTLPRAQRGLILLLAALLLVAQLDQPYPDVAPLHHIPTLVVLVAAPWLLRRWPVSTRSLVCIVLFLALHTLGGRYTYSNVPYDEWALIVSGSSLSDIFGWERNHYDRFVHFAFGALSVAPVMEIARRWAGLGRAGAMLAVIGWVFAISSLYEIFEWLLAVVMAADMAANYNGQQGDVWDAQKDMILAALGAVLALLFIPRR